MKNTTHQHLKQKSTVPIDKDEKNTFGFNEW